MVQRGGEYRTRNKDWRISKVLLECGRPLKKYSIFNAQFSMFNWNQGISNKEQGLENFEGPTGMWKTLEKIFNIQCSIFNVQLEPGNIEQGTRIGEFRRSYWNVEDP